MSDEKGYRAHIVDYETAMERLGGFTNVDGIVVNKAYELWQTSLKYEKLLREEQAKEVNDTSPGVSEERETSEER